jgi:hypothetical protein
MTDIRNHSSDDISDDETLPNITEPVAVVLRADGSIDVYGFVAVVDQRADADTERLRDALAEWESAAGEDGSNDGEHEAGGELADIVRELYDTQQTAAARAYVRPVRFTMQRGRLVPPPA